MRCATLLVRRPCAFAFGSYNVEGLHFRIYIEVKVLSGWHNIFDLIFSATARAKGVYGTLEWICIIASRCNGFTINDQLEGVIIKKHIKMSRVIHILLNQRLTRKQHIREDQPM